jgi:CheY-like chemotaxis protein
MKKVLLVEDDLFIRDITSIKLSEHGYTVLTAQNGQEALSLSKVEMPDAILLDLDLPDMSGLEVMKTLAATPDLQHVPVIIFSNNDNPETLASAKELGAAAFFVKATTNFDDLNTQLTSLLGA